MRLRLNEMTWLQIHVLFKLDSGKLWVGIPKKHQLNTAKKSLFLQYVLWSVLRVDSLNSEKYRAHVQLQMTSSEDYVCFKLCRKKSEVLL